MKIKSGNNTFVQEMKYTFSGDHYGNCMSWAFALCDYLCDIGESDKTTKWNFRQSPIGSDNESFEYQQIEVMIENNPSLICCLREFNNILYRYYNYLIFKGKNY
jgi:hypothetical protein